MSKIYIFTIVFVVIGVFVLSFYFLANSKAPNVKLGEDKQILFGQNQTQAPTNAIISPAPSDSTSAANMDNFQILPDGLKIQDEVVGTGAEVKSGDSVTVNYLGTLENGTKFDSSYDRNQPFTTQIGVGQVIKGWDEGIVGMKVGGKRKLVIPPSLGYGEQNLGVIPPNSTLLFEVEVLSVK